MPVIWSKSRFQHAFEIYPRVLKEASPVLLPLNALLWGLEFYVSWLNKARFDNPYESSMLTMVVIGVLGVVLQSLISVLWILFVARSAQRQAHNGVGEHPWLFVKKHYHQSLIESVRAFISVGIYGLFLILPALYRWVQITFAVLVSAFDPQYQAGQKDALQESARLVRGAWLPLFLLMLFQFFAPLIFEESAKSSGLTLASPFFYLLAWMIHLYFGVYMALTFFARHSLCQEKV